WRQFLSAPRISPRPDQMSRMTTAELRAAFLVEDVYSGDGKLRMTFTDLDRMALGGARPGTEPVVLENDRETGADFFLARRELGVINVGGPGVVRVDGKEYPLA